ncbi:MAG: isoprenoid biosynthesis glyoxalase ElbB [Magnetococcales bacterium]|nr:isoprenoid biosynthesis glyoxalase ElbB [Magnetococcales bacterium]
MAKKRIGVVLAGCGVYDGAEIHEATLTLYFLDRAGAEWVAMAPNIDQHHVVDHLTGQVVEERRNVLAEAARIARGKIRDLAEVRASELDGLIMPGGFGVAKNLSSIAFNGAEAEVNPDLAVLLRDMHRLNKPIGAICISPAVVSRVFAQMGVTVTIGCDPGTISAIEAMGNRHQTSPADGIVLDEEKRVVSTPAYMCGAGIAEVARGIEKLVSRVLELAN